MDTFKKLLEVLTGQEENLLTVIKKMKMNVEEYVTWAIKFRSENMALFDSNIEMFPADLYSKVKVFIYNRPWRAIKKRGGKK
jgi:hypothetical protein